MAAGSSSRYLLCEVLMDSQERIYFGQRARFMYRELPDNKFHRVREGDTLFGLAGTYYADTKNSALLYWVIADFQPTPIHDPTIQLDLGRVLVIPSLRTVMEQILNPSRRPEFKG